MKNKPVCYVSSQKNPEIFSGTPTFMGLPKASAREELSAYDIVFMGVPWEGICTWGKYSKCELATKIIRDVSVRYSGYLPEYDLDIFDHISGCDYGDAAVQSGNEALAMESAALRMRDVLDAGKFPVTFGGDHSITAPLVHEMVKKHPGRLGLIHFDAHMDNLFAFGGEKNARCCPMHRIYEAEGFNPKNMVSVGIRGPRNHPDALKTAREKGATVINRMEVHQKGYMESIRRAIDIASDGTDGFYVTVCSDILDVAHNPGGPPDPCGMSTFELAMMLHECGLKGALGFDYVEIYPDTDPGNFSCHNAVWMTLYMLAGVVLRTNA